MIDNNKIPEKPEILHCEKHGDYEVKYLTIGDRVIERKNCGKCAEESNKMLREKEEAERKERVEKARLQRLINCGVSKRNIGKTFDTFNVNHEGQQKALDACKAICHAIKAGNRAPNMFMIGSVGTGKTHLSASIIHDLLPVHSVNHVRMIDLMRELKDTWRRDSEVSETDVINHYANLDLLIIDEVGIQFGSDAEKMFIFDIINGRYDNIKPTVLISNLDLQNLKATLGDQVIDRLREDGGKVIVFDWESLRK